MDRTKPIVSWESHHRIVYILISENKDFYVEETFLSIHSLFKHNPEFKITIVTDKETFTYLQETNKLLNNLEIEYKIVDIPDKYSKKIRSRYLKTKLRDIISGDYLYLDTDTLILQPIDRIFESKADISAVLESHRNDKNIYHLNKYIRHTSQSKKEIGKYFNSGVMFVKDTQSSHKLYKDWHNLWLEDLRNKDWYMDQPALARAEFRNPGVIMNVEGEYNCQIMSFQSKLNNLADYMNILDNVHIFHYFNKTKEDSSFPLKKVKFWEDFRSGGMTDHIEIIIDDPLKFYYRDWLLELSGNTGKNLSKENKNTTLLKKIAGIFHFPNRK